jgi:hypothetical protein
MRTMGCLLALFLLAGCNQQELLQKFSSAEDQATAKGYIDKLRAHDFDEIEKDADESITSPSLHSTLVKMADLIPPREPSSVKLVGAQSFHVNDTATVNTTFEYNFGDEWLLASVAVKSKNGVKTIVGFHVNPETQALELQNAFHLSGKPMAAYVVLGMALAAVLLTLYSLVICVRTKLTGRKWPWVLFIIVGLGKIAVNWTTGQWGFSPLYVQLFSASAVAPLYGPWTISASMPLGAVLFLFYRRVHTTGRGHRHGATP